MHNHEEPQLLPFTYNVCKLMSRLDSLSASLASYHTIFWNFPGWHFYARSQHSSAHLAFFQFGSSCPLSVFQYPFGTFIDQLRLMIERRVRSKNKLLK